MHSVLLSDATDDADLAKEVFLGAMVVDEQHECRDRDEKWRGRGQATRGVTPGRLRGRNSEGVTLMLLTDSLRRKV